MTNKTHYIDKSAVRGILEDLGGRFVTVNAIKKDGKPTKHNGQLRESPPSHTGNSKLFTIEKSNKGGFRSFEDDKVTRIAGDGKIYAVVGSLDGLI